MKKNAFSWIATLTITAVFAFLFCPEELIPHQKAHEIDAQKNLIGELVSRIESEEITLDLIKAKDTFTMERLVREEFNLKNKYEQQLHSSSEKQK